MYSIIDYFDKNGLKYAVTSTEPLSSAYEPNNSFSKSTSFFASYVWPNYWQITFERLVKIDSYTISLPSISWTMTEWKISFSLDDENFTLLQEEKTTDMRENANKFKLKSYACSLKRRPRQRTSLTP